jgi:hypothetical protein
MTADFDEFDLPSPRARRPRAKATASPGGRGKPPSPSRARRLWGFARRYPLEVAITLALSGAVGAIAYNALLLQTSRHPAPFFGQGGKVDGPAPLPPARPLAPVPAPAPAPLITTPTPPSALPPTRAPARDSIGELIKGSDPGTLRLAPARPPPPVPRPPAPPPPPRDPIGDLIRFGGDAPPIPPALVGHPDPARTVAAGQRALAKLGYGPMKADGVLGPGTRQAIERFERDRHLPVTGEFAGRTVRELSTLSGIPVE